MDVVTILKQLRDAGALDGVLRRVSLETRSTAIVRLVLGAGIFAAGALLGAGAGLALAPMTGDEMRERARDRVDGIRDRLAEAREQARIAAEGMEKKARKVAGSSKNARKTDSRDV